jgi:hypothetical protein
MTTPALNSRVQSLVTEYGVFWQFWPQFEQIHGDRRLVGFEVEYLVVTRPISTTSIPDAPHAGLSGPRCCQSRTLCPQI